MEEIARRTGGQALRTSDVLDLSSSFVSLFFDVCALQKNTDWRGRIAQGERKYVAGIFVPPFTQRLDATALWMGSEVDLELVPFGRGRMAGGTRSHGIQYISRRSPRPGFYRVHLYGREIPEGGEDCRVIVGVTPSLMQHDAWGYLLIGLLIVPFLLFRALRAVDQGAT